MSFSSALGKFLGKCCCAPCPLCPDRLHYGWTVQKIDGCPQCVDCPPCPDYPAVRGYVGSFDNRCPKCPACTDNPCYIPRDNPDEPCVCIPTRFLCVLAGVGINCDCGPYSCPIGLPEDNDEFTSHQSWDGAYCQDDPGNLTLPFNAQQWSALPTGYGPGPDCAAPRTIQSIGTHAELSFSVSFGVITADVNVTAYMDNGQQVDIFFGHVVFGRNPCKGPWVVPNQLATGCTAVCNEFGGIIEEKFRTGGTAIIYACAC